MNGIELVERFVKHFVDLRMSNFSCLQDMAGEEGSLPAVEQRFLIYPPMGSKPCSQLIETLDVDLQSKLAMVNTHVKSICLC